MLRAGALACREEPLFTSGRQGDHFEGFTVVPERRGETGERYKDGDRGYPWACPTALHEEPEAEEEYERDQNSTGNPFFTVCERDLRRPPEKCSDHDKRIYRKQEEPYPHCPSVRHAGVVQAILD